MLKRKARAARTALLVTSLSCALATGQIVPEPRFFNPGVQVIGVLDYDDDGVDELIGKSVDGSSILAVRLSPDGTSVLERRIATALFDTDDFSLADVNGDGLTDFVGVRRLTTGDQAVAFLGDGSPEFGDPVVLGPMAIGVKLMVVDFDLDGILDLVQYPASDDLENEFQPSSNFFQLKGLGSGIFSTLQIAQGFGLTLQGAVPVELDQDNDQDFVGIITLTKDLAVARNTGATLELQTIPGTMTGYLDLDVADVNGDSYPDIVAFRRDDFGTPANVDLALGNAAGGFDAPTSILVDAPGLVADVNLGDFNGDLNIDVAITTEGSVQAAHSILLLAGDGQGGFTAGLPSSTGEGRARIRATVGDLNGDGLDDLVSGSFAQTSQSSGGRDIRLARFGVPAGGLADLGLAIETSPMPFTSNGLTGDLNGDGVQDLIGNSGQSISWTSGTAESNEFGPIEVLSVVGEPLVVADFDNDGIDEVLVQLPSSAGFRMIDSQGGGNFTSASVTLPLPPNARELLAADFDGDGDIDLVTSSIQPNAYVWMPNLLGFQFAPPVDIGLDLSLFPIPPMFLGDFNADGITDLLLFRYQVPFTIFVVWAEGLGGGAVGPMQDIVEGTNSVLGVFDVDRDGVDDVLWKGDFGGSSMNWSPGGPNGPMTANNAALVATDNLETPVGIADVDGDGLADLLTRMPLGEVFGYLRRPGPQVEFEPTPIVVAERPIGGPGPVSQSVLVDFGADGDLDLFAGLFQTPAWHENVSRGPVGASFCGPVNPNSTGVPSRIFSVGTDDVSENSLALRAADLPTNAFGFFIVSSASQPATSVTASSGLLCLAGSIGRYVGAGQVGSSGPSGTLALDLDLTAIPQPLGFVAAQPGSTWFFQAWHRDSSLAGPTSNFTDGLQVTFE